MRLELLHGFVSSMNKLFFIKLYRYRLLYCVHLLLFFKIVSQIAISVCKHVRTQQIICMITCLVSLYVFILLIFNYIQFN